MTDDATSPLASPVNLANPADPVVSRCAWATETAQMAHYHDTEWGFPVTDEVRLFEKVSLEGFQAGLSWRTILEKREAFRKEFSGFDPVAVAAFGEAEIERMLGNPDIVRHRGKIAAVVHNAARVSELQREYGSLAAYFWSFEPSRDELGAPNSITTSPSSVALSRDLKRRGWKFVGPTTMFALMEAMGLINNHELDCALRPAVDAARRAFTRPVRDPA